ncbi:hypothetical protein CVT26_004953 [Gymnopilus dilepis]|uniref:Uncharacterized protein n=1 Tax=Gymnopilus dilepis TaxID=231916 RepID=A0A409XZW9_9AGAR|nr:hypothetical protein CVT26_004953 [Gymnopilus dilepis]
MLQNATQALYSDLHEANNLIKATNWPYFNICTVLTETFRKAQHQMRAVHADEVVHSLQVYDRMKQSKIKKEILRLQEQQKSRDLPQMESSETTEQQYARHQEQGVRPALPHEPKDRAIQQILSNQHAHGVDRPPWGSRHSGEHVKKIPLRAHSGTSFRGDPTTEENKYLECTVSMCSTGSAFSDTPKQSAKWKELGGGSLKSLPSYATMPTSSQCSSAVPRWKSEPLLVSPTAPTAQNALERETMTTMTGRRERKELYLPPCNTCSGQKRRREEYWDSSKFQSQRRFNSAPPETPSKALFPTMLPFFLTVHTVPAMKKQKNHDGSFGTSSNELRGKIGGPKSTQDGDLTLRREISAEERGRTEESTSTEVLDALRSMTEIIVSLQQKQSLLRAQLNELIGVAFHQEVRQ